jgi:hypothetical protein
VLAFIGLAFLYGMLLSFGALLIEEHAFAPLPLVALHGCASLWRR